MSTQELAVSVGSLRVMLMECSRLLASAVPNRGAEKSRELQRRILDALIQSGHEPTGSVAEGFGYGSRVGRDGVGQESLGRLLCVELRREVDPEPSNDIVLRALTSEGDGAEISPCPFCASADLAMMISNETYVHCNGCGADGPIAEGETGDEAEATATREWNRRPIEQVTDYAEPRRRIVPGMSREELVRFHDQWLIDTEDVAKGHELAGKPGVASLLIFCIASTKSDVIDDGELKRLVDALNRAALVKIRSVRADGGGGQG